MTTGSPDDIVQRVKRVIPRKWWLWVAPIRDAIIGGLSDIAAWSYNLIAYARAQSRLSTSYGIWLDIFAFDFVGHFLIRNGAQDDTFRRIIRSTILQERVTRPGMVNAITMLTSNAPVIFEPWNTADTGAYTGLPGTPRYGSMGYNVGHGGYGNMNLPAQAFITIIRGAGAGVPGVSGYGNNISGYGIGAIEYVGKTSELSGITDPIIFDLINKTKPTGTTIWVAFAPPVTELTTDSGVLLTTDDGSQILTNK